MKSMKNGFLVTLFVLGISMTGCEAIAGIFKAGIWTGIIIVVIIIAVIMYIVRKK